MSTKVKHREWTPYKDGFIKGNIGVFPSIGTGAWEVWDKFSGEWECSEPYTYAAKEGRTYDPDRRSPYVYWERNNDEILTKIQQLADQWLENRLQKLKGGS